ncbi:hypothetical protein BDW66DRAFT_155795 [Aspergillus desertorum]
MGFKWWYIVVAIVDFAILIAAYFLVVETMFDRSLHGKVDWRKFVSVYKETAQGICILSISWLLLVNGAFLGVYVYQTSTFGVILTPPPYSFSNTSLGFVQLVQVLDCLILVPVMGYGTDLIAKKMSQWKNGVFEVQ